MKKILIAVLSIYYLLNLILCFGSLSTPRNFGILFIVPATFAFIVHVVLLFIKRNSFYFTIIIAICDVLYFASPFLIFGLFSIDIFLLLMWIIPLIISAFLCIFIIREKKKTD